MREHGLVEVFLSRPESATKIAAMTQAKAIKNTPATRLSEIWRAWGMKQAAPEANEQRQALDALAKFLQGGAPAILRGMQALLVDPDEPGASKRPLFGDLWTALQDHWSTAGVGDGDVMLLQAMLLAAWPEALPGQELSPALLSPWMASRGRNRQRDELRRWRDGCAFETMKSETSHTSLPGPIKTRSVPISSLTSIEQMQSNPHTVTFVDRSNNRYSALATSGFDALKNALQAAVTESNERMTVLHEQAIQLIREGHDIASRRSENIKLSEYLWWGQARYCHTLHIPLRRITEVPKAVWLAALEAAERAAELPIEPSASYLQEVLHGLGFPMQEKRTIWDHLTGLRDTIDAHPPSPVPPLLTNLLKQDSFGVPISLLCADPTVPDDKLRIQLGVVPDTELDLGEWSAWVFRELVFLRRWPEQK
jgi:hypothetical protein